MQVGEVHLVVVDEDELADAGGGEGEQRGGAEPARPDDADPGGGQPALPDRAEPGERGVPGGPGALLRAQLRNGLDERRQRHDPRVVPFVAAAARPRRVAVLSRRCG